MTVHVACPRLRFNRSDHRRRRGAPSAGNPLRIVGLGAISGAFERGPPDSRWRAAEARHPSWRDLSAGEYGSKAGGEICLSVRISPRSSPWRRSQTPPVSGLVSAPRAGSSGRSLAVGTSSRPMCEQPMRLSLRLLIVAALIAVCPGRSSFLGGRAQSAGCRDAPPASR